MRGHLILLSAVALVACSDGRGSAGESVATNFTGFSQDPIALRVARGGGLVRAYHYPRLDSIIWSSTQPVGAQSRNLAFDPENGLLAYVDGSGASGWVDLRVGTVKPSRANRQARPGSTDGWSIYGVTRDTLIHRSTPSGEWEFGVPARVTALFPLPDGGLVVMYSSDSASRLIRLRPPDPKLVDSAAIATPDHAIMSPLGDRMYLAFDRELAAINARTFDEVGRVRFEGPIVALATTPSGDRVFVASEDTPEIAVLDRYSGEQATAIRVPGPVRDFRADPLGRLLLARPDSGDSTWVISVASNTLVATLPTGWRTDLPAVAPDGSVATIPDRDVHFTMPGQAKPRIIVRTGTAEIWQFVYWNGFRPRAPGLDQPVVFPVDSVEFGSAVRDIAEPPAPAEPQPPLSAVPPPPDSITIGPPVQQPDVYSVQVAALLSEDRAQDVVREVRQQGLRARVVVSTTDGVRIYRVVMGPYATRAEADRAGRLSGKSYWVFEGVP
ncbi:MAG TPA: SPOR domain-containing protein [Gemmatimonadaceae bacterium]